MNAKISLLVICVEAIIYFFLYYLPYHYYYFASFALSVPLKNLLHVWLTHFMPRSFSILLENIRKPLVFRAYRKRPVA